MQLVVAADVHARGRTRVVDRLDADELALEEDARITAADAGLNLEVVALVDLLGVLGRQVRQRDDRVIGLVEIGLDEHVMHVIAGERLATELDGAMKLRRNL